VGTPIINTAVVADTYTGVTDDDDATVTVRRRTPPRDDNGDTPTPPIEQIPPTEPQEPPVYIPDPDMPLVQYPDVYILDLDVPLAEYPDEPEDPTRRPIPQTGDEFSYRGLMTSGIGLLLSLLAMFMLFFAKAPKLAVETGTTINDVRKGERFKFAGAEGFTPRVDFIQRFRNTAKRRE
jgi:hypothetical protein